jgi:hypothetical protein
MNLCLPLIWQIDVRTTLKVCKLRQLLIQRLQADASIGARRSDVPVPSPADVFKQAFLESGKKTVKTLSSEDITSNVRLILNGGARKLPQSPAADMIVLESLIRERLRRYLSVSHPVLAWCDTWPLSFLCPTPMDLEWGGGLGRNEQAWQQRNQGRT